MIDPLILFDALGFVLFALLILLMGLAGHLWWAKRSDPWRKSDLLTRDLKEHIESRTKHDPRLRAAMLKRLLDSRKAR